MPETSDFELLAQFARDSSEVSFSALIERHVNLVYSVALRCTSDPHAAGEITQAVFIILARKAKSLSPKTILSVWLHQTARLTAANYLRAEIRRRHHEQEAYMQSTLIEATGDDVWRELAPLLDEAIGRLRNQDRDALILRYFENKSLSEVGMVLGIKERAAQKRVDRAVGKLRKYFLRNGIASTTAVIAGVVSANSIQGAPIGLVATVTATAVKGSTSTTSTLALVKGMLKAMTWAKVKFACGIGATVLLAGSVGTITVVNAYSREIRYQITGNIDYVTSSRVFTRDFILTVNGPNWAVTLTNLGPEVTGTKYFEDVGFNGSVYHYWYAGKPEANSRVINSGGATIENGDFPVENGSFANFVWVGLASGYYFSRLTNDEVTSMLAGLNARSEKAKAQWQLFTTPPFLPKSIDYYHKPIQGIILRPGVILHQFDNGWKSGEVRVLEETNVRGSTFPLVYTYEQFKPKLNETTSTNETEHQLLVTVRVRTISLDSVPDVLPPKTKGTTAVGEARFPNNAENKQTVYFSALDRLPEKPEAAAIKGYNQEQKQPLKPPSNHKWIWLSGIVIAVAGAVIVGLMRRKR